MKIYIHTRGRVGDDTIGVYAIIHKPTGKAYVGSSRKSIQNRFCWHESRLRNGNHRCKKFQRLWDNSHHSDWEFKILEECEPDEAYVREDYWMTKFKLLNIYPNVKGYGRKLSKEHRRSLSLAASSPEGIRRRSEQFKKLHMNGTIGYAAIKDKEKWRKNARKIAKREHANGTLGYATIKDKVTWRKNVRRSASRRCQLISPKGVEFVYDSVSEAAIQHKLKAFGLRKVAQGRQKHTDGWGCRYI